MVWNWIAWFFNFCDRSREREIYAELHKILYDEGWKYQISFYGTLASPYDDKHVMARIEVVGKQSWTPEIIQALFNKFSCFRPDREYTLVCYSDGSLIEVKPT